MDADVPKKTRKPSTTAQHDDSQGDMLGPADILDAARQEVLHQVQVRPYTTVFVAVGLGYIIGAGAPRWASGIAWTLGSRAIMARIISAL